MTSAVATTRQPGGTVTPPGGRRPARRFGVNRMTMLALVAPSVLLLLLINAYPFLSAANQSVHNGSLINPGSFVGLDNYGSVLTSQPFWQAAQFTLIFTIVGVFGSWAVGLGMALLLQTDIPGRGVFKVLLLLPWVVPIVVSATAINYLVATPSSPVPSLFNALGLGAPLFLANPTWAKVTVCVYKVWVSFPFMMLMSSAALATVDPTLYEAAQMDGASAFQRFRRVTLPIIARPTYISWILMTIFCVNDFPTIYLVTGGGPVSATTTLVVLAYRTVFQNFEVGPGVAIAFMMTLTLVVVSVVLYRQIKRAAFQ